MKLRGIIDLLGEPLAQRVRVSFSALVLLASVV
jgi:hypothetical protein